MVWLGMEFYVEILFPLKFEEFSLSPNNGEVFIGSLIVLFLCKWLPHCSDIQIFPLLLELPTFTMMSLSWWHPFPLVLLAFSTSVGVKLMIVRSNMVSWTEQTIWSQKTWIQVLNFATLSIFKCVKPCKILYLHLGSFFSFLPRRNDNSLSPALSCHAPLFCRIIVIVNYWG